MSEEIAADYVSSLADLTVNSKPHINMLTMLADDNMEHAAAIVKAVEKHLEKVPSDTKLPVLYLIDSIIKNVAGDYKTLFAQNIANTFCNAFEKVDEKTRANLFKLRQTWNDVIPSKKLYLLDTKVNIIDPAWPITAAPPKIHLNPRFLNSSTNSPSVSAPTPPSPLTPVTPISPALTTDAVMMEQLLLQKQKKLIELKQEKLRLELLQTQAQLDEQQKMLEKKTGHLKLLSEKSQQKKNKLDSVQIPTQTEEQKKLPIKQSIDTSSTPIRKLMQKITNKDTNKIVNKTTVKNGNSSIAQVSPIKAPAHVENSPKIEPKVVVSPSKTESPKGNSKFEPTVKPSIGKGGDALLKPYATAEFNIPPSSSKKSSSPKPSKFVKTSNVRTDFGQISKLKSQAITQEKREPTSADLKIMPAVISQPRIAPVSSQLISAARRQTRDPRILRRQMEEPLPEHPPKPHSPPKMESCPKIKQKTSIEEDKIKSQSKQKDKEAGKQLTHFKSKSKKDKKSSRHSREEKQHKMYQIVKDFKTKSQETDKFQFKKEKKEVDEALFLTPQQFMDSLFINKSKSPVPENVDKLNTSLNSDKLSKNDVSEKVEVSKQIEVNKEIDLPFKSEQSSVSEKVEVLEQSDLKKDVECSLPLSSPSKDSPPPPPVISDKSKETKSASLSRIRKYVRNREGSESPPMTEVVLQKETPSLLSTKDSTPPPPIISDKFKEMKPASLSRLRKYVRNREGSESPPITGDVDLRHVMAPLSDDHKKEVVGNEAVSTEKDIDLRQFPASPTKKRPSVERSEAPPPKKSKAEVFDELFGKEDVDLRTLPPPSPPPPPVISHISTEEKENGTERSWAKYKQQKPDTFKSPYRYTHLKSPSFNKKGSAVPSNWRAKIKPYPSKDTDMRHQFGPGSNYDIIIKQAHEQYNSGSLTDNDYKKIVTEVISMNEIRQVEEAQRLDEEELRKEEEYEELEPISDDEMNSYSESHNFSVNKDTLSLNDIDKTLPTGNEADISNQNKENEHEMIIDKDKSEETVETIATDLERKRYSDSDKTNKTIKPLSDSHSPRFREDVGHQRDDIPESDRKRYHRDRERRDEHRYRHEQKLRRRNEVRESRMFRRNRYGQAEQEVWETPPFEGRHTDSQIPIEMEHSGSGSFNPPDLPKPVILDKSNFGDGEIVMNMDIPPSNLTMHPLRFGNDSNVDNHETSRSTVPWEPSRLPSPWIRNIPPLMRPLPLLRPPLDIQRFGPNRWRAPPPNIPLRQPFEGDNNIRFNRFHVPPNSGSPRPQTLAPGELPPADPHVLELIAADPTNCINIDGKSKDIRFYGDTACAMMEWDDPREVSFQGGQRRIIVDDRDSMLISFNSPYRDMLIDGQTHRVRFGAPTRELYIDGKWYECFFGGPPISIEISGKMRTVQLEGPPPQVRTSVQRKDLVVGKVKLIVDAKYIFDLYLDPKPQRFDIEGTPIIIRFVEALCTLVINGITFKSDFGGLPKAFILKGKKHFFRLTTLPQGVTPGYLTISHMEGGRLPSPTPSGALPAPPQIPLSLQNIDLEIEPESSSDTFVLPAPPPVSLPPIASPDTNEKSENIKDIPEVLQHSLSNTSKSQLPPPPVPVNPLDMLASLLPPAAVSRTSSYSYSVEAEQKEVPAANHAQPVAFGSSSFLSGEVNVAELLQKLIATGIVSSVTNTQDATAAKEKPADSDAIVPVDFNKPETLKTKQSGMVTSFYSGIQCSSCGVRFPPEQTMKYSQHLDWHFRQNRRDKDSARMAQSRKWYYDISDWIQFEEIEDLEDRAQSWFESQAGQNSNSAEAEEPPGEVPSVAAGESPEDAACEICRDKFEQFYNEEREEWHLRQAVRVDEKLYHPICYQDYKASLDAPIEVSLDESEDKDDEVPELEKTAPVVEQVDVDDDDLEVIECEIIQPVFPIEDLTTSDCESVVDATEKKTDPTDLIDEEKEKEISEASNIEKIDEEISSIDKNEGNVIDEVIIEDKEEMTIDVEAVVKKIKQEPLDDEIMDSEVAMKKEREQIDMPEPVVDTTHVAVECSIDGNLQFDDSPQIAVIAPPKIKINITKPISAQTTTDKDIKESESDITNSEAPVPTPSLPLSVFKTIVETQPPPPGEEPGPLHLKPRLLGKKLQDLPQLSKGSELSGLCSIM